MLNHNFWFSEYIKKTTSNYIDNDEKDIKINNEVYTEDNLKLPDNFYWDEINNDNKMDELILFLNEHYIDNKNDYFKLEHTKEFTKWLLEIPNFYYDWFICIRSKSNNKIMGFISSIPYKIKINENTILNSSIINLLCVHSKLRDKRMSVILIKEISRRIYYKGYRQAIYVNDLKLPCLVNESKYYHRFINIKNLLDFKFCSLKNNMTVKMMEKLYKIDNFNNKSVRKIKYEDIENLVDKLNIYLDKYSLHPIFDKCLFEHLFYNNSIVTSLVIENKKGELTDFISYYILPCKCKDNKKIIQGYLFYYFNNSFKLENLINECLIFCKNDGIDVLTVLSIMNNNEFIPKLKFVEGSSCSNYYLYNYEIKHLESNEIGFIIP